MLNIEKYKNEIMNGSHADLACDINVDVMNLPCGSNCKECKKSVVKWLLSEYKEPILNDAEKEYLSAVIKPFRNRVDYIMKEENICSSTEFIHIDLSGGDIADFPNFKVGTMYKGMEIDKSYTLQELGL